MCEYWQEQDRASPHWKKGSGRGSHKSQNLQLPLVSDIASFLFRLLKISEFILKLKMFIFGSLQVVWLANFLLCDFALRAILF